MQWRLYTSVASTRTACHRQADNAEARFIDGCRLPLARIPVGAGCGHSLPTTGLPMSRELERRVSQLEVTTTPADCMCGQRLVVFLGDPEPEQKTCPKHG